MSADLTANSFASKHRSSQWIVEINWEHMMQMMQRELRFALSYFSENKALLSLGETGEKFATSAFI